MTKTEWKAFLKSELESSEIKGIVDALLESKDDPSVALRASALVELSLTESLLSRLWRNKGQADAELTGLGGPLATFASKIRMAEAMRIIGPKTRHDLDTIKAIRNDFAHCHRQITFDNLPVAQLCRSLTVVYWPGIPQTPESERTPKDQFTFCAIGLFLILRERAIQTPRYATPKRTPIYKVRKWWTEEYPEPMP
ncbi:hypothetical protein [Granulicella sp. L46]|uniref:hypothetical protein n=1 Tax=Granulicella sp. L46 TaxID=1641865 RepID=UPI00131E8ADA|nr:hypothetical protein [Granulicella sp. L46]